MGDAGDAPFDIVVRRACVFDGANLLAGPRDVGLRGERIAAVSENPLTGRTIVDGAGAWLLPGLMDVHIHLFDFNKIVDDQSMAAFIEGELPRRLMAFLERGITTVKSVGDPESEILATRARIAAGDLAGPRLFATGPGISAPHGHPGSTVYGRNPWYGGRAAAEVETAAGARAVVRRLADRGVDAIKLLAQGGCRCSRGAPYVWRSAHFGSEVTIYRIGTAVLEAAIDEAHRYGLRATVHTVEQGPAVAALAAGADGLEHGVVHEAITDPAILAGLKSNDATYVPTLWVHARDTSLRNLALVAEAGVTVALGTDSFSGRGAFGENTLEETELMVEAGLAPLEVLRAATGHAARHLGRSDVGTIVPGNLADLVLVRGDPARDVRDLRNLLMVVKDGDIVVDRRGG